MAANPTPVTGYTIEFVVTSRVAKVVHATDSIAQPRKFTSSPTLTEDELVELCREVAEKAAAAYQHTRPTFDLLIDERGYIQRDPTFARSLPAAFAAESAPRAATIPKPRKPKRKPAASKPNKRSTARKPKKRK